MKHNSDRVILWMLAAALVWALLLTAGLAWMGWLCAMK